MDIIFCLFTHWNHPQMRKKPEIAEQSAPAETDGGRIGGTALGAGDFLAICLVAN
jgi:hypothetical protein